MAAAGPAGSAIVSQRTKFPVQRNQEKGGPLQAILHGSPTLNRCFTNLVHVPLSSLLPWSAS